uniref:BTB domain-containing protein n=1 Tax=Meloidogyne hapla TaxID=6305 RepID=A0A1I8BTU0_MELHA
MPLDVKCKPKETFKFSPADTSHKLLTNMFQQGTLTDCVINIGDEKINAHSCILAQNSEVFLRMFEQKGMLEAQNVLKSRKRPYETGEINIVDYSAECFRAFLEYLYTGEINKILLEKHVDDLFTLSDKYEVLPLREICVQVMASKITATNFYKRYSFAEIFKLPLVEMACINFISANRKTFLGSNEWNEFKRANKDLATKLLESSAFD